MPAKRVPRTRARPATSAKGSSTLTSEHSRRKTKLSSESQHEDLEEVVFPPGVEPAFVRVAMGQTYNMGDFNSLRLDVSVTLPCHPRDIDETYKSASEFCAEKLEREETLWLGSKGR